MSHPIFLFDAIAAAMRVLMLFFVFSQKSRVADELKFFENACSRKYICAFYFKFLGFTLCFVTNFFWFFKWCRNRWRCLRKSGREWRRVLERAVERRRECSRASIAHVHVSNPSPRSIFSLTSPCFPHIFPCFSPIAPPPSHPPTSTPPPPNPHSPPPPREKLIQ